MGKDIKLTRCRVSDDVEVVEVSGNAGLAARLGELGMIPGARLRVIRQGSPIIVQLDDTRLCLRSRDASKIMVRAFAPRTATDLRTDVSPVLGNEALVNEIPS